MINAMKGFAARRVFLFGVLAVFFFILLVILANIFGAFWPVKFYGPLAGNAVARSVFIACLILLLSHLGWLQPAGFRWPGRPQVWLVVLLPTAYATGVSAFAMSGNLSFSVSSTVDASVHGIFYLIAAFLEETIFRGIILYAMIRVWGGTKGGFWRSVLASTLLFALMHWADYLGGSLFLNVFLQSLVAFWSGILFSALLLYGGSIYPAVLAHFVINYGVSLNLTSNQVEPAPSNWMLLNLLVIPAGLYGLYLLWKIKKTAL